MPDFFFLETHVQEANVSEAIFILSWACTRLFKLKNNFLQFFQRFHVQVLTMASFEKQSAENQSNKLESVEIGTLLQRDDTSL